MVFGCLKRDNNISQFLDVAKLNNSNDNNATEPDNPTYFSVLNIISNSNLTQFNSSTYNNARTSDKTRFFGCLKSD